MSVNDTSEVLSDTRSTGKKTVQSRKFLIFQIGGELLTAPLADVKEIIGVPAATPLPGAASHVRGFINLRGKIISLIDLAKRLGSRGSSAGAGSRPCTIVVEKEGVTAGFIVDDVSEVLRIEKSQIDEEVRRADSAINHVITGVVKLRDRPLALLIDLPRLAVETVGAEQTPASF